MTKLLKVKGDFATLYGVIEGFMKHSKGTPNEIRAIEHLREIEYSYEEVEKTNRK
ncbi:hypothetical protein [Myroides sp. WP-1]|uniref:hypothetical protein n=1 Tax=Myroides sp. WP-1 TaxID=2759944 RepID=UPI0015FA77BF|nr:hypothetical protein [Myroides sp. WP-1]MBB1141033.1 hypothetical protein [Myroides sp. WP-1]